LFLLLVVQESVEFLDSEPFVFLVDLGVDIGLSRLDSASRDLRKIIGTTARSDAHGFIAGREGVD
jgi:hypothetical protein